MAGDEWTVRRTLEWCRGYLAAHDDSNPRLSAEWLLAHATGLSRIELYVNFDKPLTGSERDVLREALKRRGRGEPLQYISGQAAFRHIIVSCAPGVLVPRPETEVLVQEVLDWAAAVGTVGSASGKAGAPGGKDALHEDGAPSGADVPYGVDESGEADVPYGVDEAGEADVAYGVDESGAGGCMRVLEVGCGTGCIAISLAKEAGMNVVAGDISSEALACARRNVEAHRVADLVDVVETDCASGLEGPFDILVSNPPYIPTSVLAGLDREVADFEPRLALDGGSDGLAFFDRLLVEAVPLLRSGGLFACELFEDSLEEAASRAEAAGLLDVRIINDLAGKPRVLCACTSLGS